MTICVGTLAGCGNVDVEVVVRSTLSDAELAAVTAFAVVVSKNDLQLARVSQSRGEGPMRLPTLEWETGVQVHVAGLRDSGVAAGYGDAAPRFPSDPTDCCFAVCLCAPQAHAAGTCECGRDVCTKSCE